MASRIIGALRELVEFFSGDRPQPMVVWVPDADGIMHQHIVHSPEEMYRLQKERVMDAEVITKGTMSVLDPTGHTEINWSSNNPDEVATAREMFNRMTGRGYQAFRRGASKGERGSRITEFDASIEHMIVFPQLQGG